MPKIKLTVEYNGTDFHGWQYQPGLRTIQSELARVLSIALRRPVAIGDLQASGRTDSGVHAKGQVVCFGVEELPEMRRLKRSVSSLLKGELSVTDLELVGNSFDPCRDAAAKQYSYTIHNRDVPPVLLKGRVWFVPRQLDRDRLKEEARAFLGSHDFESFRGAGCEAKTTVRRIFESEVTENGDLLTFRVVGNGFLKQMVRTMAGTLVDIAGGHIRDRAVRDIIAARQRTAAGITAPAHGLCLDWVRYE